MEEKDIRTIQTTRGELQYYRDWNCDGSICMVNPQTIKRYREIKDQHPDENKYGVFFAFSDKQFAEGKKKLEELGHLKEGEKIYRSGGGLFGTKDGIKQFFDFYEERDNAIPKECDPQEVYFYEYNNHESMIAWDGDLEAIKLIIAYWGEDVARTIKRYNASMRIDTLVRKPIEVKGLYFMNDGEKEKPDTVWFSNAPEAQGGCYTMYGGTLYPVCDAEGNHYSIKELAGESAHYNGEKLYKFYVE